MKSEKSKMRIRQFVFCLLFLFLIIFWSVKALSKEKISSVNYKTDIKIVQTITDNSILVSKSQFTKDRVLANFGQPQSITGEYVDAAGGMIETLYYDQNYFFMPKGKESTGGFRICTPQFYLILKDSIEIKIGEGIEELLKTVSERRHFKNIEVGKSRFDIPYINYFAIPFSVSVGQKIVETDVSLSIIYNPQTFKVIEISESARH